MIHIRTGPNVVIAVVVAALLAMLQACGGAATPAPSVTPLPSQPGAIASSSGASPAAASATVKATALVVPTPAIPLPSCPAGMAAQVDNAARYGFCVPVGWGDWNDNNSQPVTQILKPKPGGNPIILPTEFSRIVIVIALNATPPSNLPAACQGAPNDTVNGLHAHQCNATLNPAQNPYHGVQARYWLIDLPNKRTFYITAVIAAGAAPQDQALVNTIVHQVRPNGT